VTGPLTTTEPIPPPRSLPPGYDRYRPDSGSERDVVAGLVDGTGWAGLSWPDLVDELIGLGRTDIPLARLGEGHVDALRILDQAGAVPEPGALYGVWASRSARTGLTALGHDDQLEISGTLRFASGAGLLDRALVPVWFDEHRSVLLDLDASGLEVDPSRRRTSAMVPSRSYEIRVEHLLVPRSAQRGPVGFYLDRPGFQAGGVGVAACWVGGVARVLDVLLAFHPHPNPAQQVRLGQIRADLVAAAATVRAGGRALADPDVDTGRVALEVRTAVADAVHRVLAAARQLTGPTGLALDDAVSQAIPDLELYVLQHNTDAALAALGDPGALP
jgi:alkylation response protein AidB-like acyl-CoA dehydrogenase